NEKPYTTPGRSRETACPEERSDEGGNERAGARGRHRARRRQPCSAQAHDGARDHARARAGALESRCGGERDEADRGPDGGRDGHFHGAHADRDSGDLLLVAAARARGNGAVNERALDTRAVVLRRGAALEVLTVGYNSVEGLVAIAAGLFGGCGAPDVYVIVLVHA